MPDTTILPAQLQAIDETVLTPLVRQLLRSDAVKILNWHIDPIQFGIVNPVTFGIFRISGTAQENNYTKTWSIVLKILQQAEILPEEVWKEPTTIFNVNREPYVYRSNLNADLPDCIAMPRCYGVTEQPDNTKWLWMEEIIDCYPAGWPLERYALAGRHLGIFNGRYLTRMPLPDYPWLNRHFLRNGVPAILNFTNIQSRLLDSATWEQPMVRCAFPTPITERFLNMVANSTLLVNLLERLPQVLCHQDANCGNLFARRNESGNDQTVLVDWAFTGISGVGCELMHLTWGTMPNRLSHSELIRLEPMVLENYLAGLRQAGWEGDETIVRYGYLAHVFFQPGIFRLNWLLTLALDETRHSQLEAELHLPITEILKEEGETIYSLLDRGEEALRLLDTVSAMV